MHRPSWKVLLFSVILMTALFGVVDQASAWCHGCGGGYVAAYGAFPAYTAYDYGWNGCCGDWYGGYGYGGCYRHHGCRTGWYGGWYAGYGYYNPCCYPTYSCCGYSAGGCCGDTGYGNGSVNVTVPGAVPQGQPTPAAPKKPVIDEGPKTGVPGEPGTTPAPAAPGTDSIPAMPGTPSTSVTPENSGMLTVWVPYDAKVFINGMATKSTGSRRTFVSYNLKDGFSYKYEVKAEVVRDGKIVEDVKTVVLTAGANNAVAFGFNIAPSEGLAAQ